MDDFDESGLTPPIEDESDEIDTREPKKYFCHWNECKEVFTEGELLFRHIVDHITEVITAAGGVSNVGEWDCRWVDCETRVKKRDHLVSHARVHVDMKPYSCNICDKFFRRTQDLKKHERSDIHLKTVDSLHQAEVVGFSPSQDEDAGAPAGHHPEGGLSASSASSSAPAANHSVSSRDARRAGRSNLRRLPAQRNRQGARPSTAEKAKPNRKKRTRKSHPPTQEQIWFVTEQKSVDETLDDATESHQSAASGGEMALDQANFDTQLETQGNHMSSAYHIGDMDNGLLFQPTDSIIDGITQPEASHTSIHSNVEAVADSSELEVSMADFGLVKMDSEVMAAEVPDYGGSMVPGPSRIPPVSLSASQLARFGLGGLPPAFSQSQRAPSMSSQFLLQPQTLASEEGLSPAHSASNPSSTSSTQVYASAQEVRHPNEDFGSSPEFSTEHIHSDGDAYAQDLEAFQGSFDEDDNVQAFPTDSRSRAHTYGNASTGSQDQQFRHRSQQYPGSSQMGRSLGNSASMNMTTLNSAPSNVSSSGGFDDNVSVNSSGGRRTDDGDVSYASSLADSHPSESPYSMGSTSTQGFSRLPYAFQASPEMSMTGQHEMWSDMRGNRRPQGFAQDYAGVDGGSPYSARLASRVRTSIGEASISPPHVVTSRPSLISSVRFRSDPHLVRPGSETGVGYGSGEGDFMEDHSYAYRRNSSVLFSNSGSMEYDPQNTAINAPYPTSANPMTHGNSLPNVPSGVRGRSPWIERSMARGLPSPEHQAQREYASQILGSAGAISPWTQSRSQPRFIRKPPTGRSVNKASNRSTGHSSEHWAHLEGCEPEQKPRRTNHPSSSTSSAPGPSSYVMSRPAPQVDRAQSNSVPNIMTPLDFGNQSNYMGSRQSNSYHSDTSFTDGAYNERPQPSNFYSMPGASNHEDLSHVSPVNSAGSTGHGAGIMGASPSTHHFSGAMPYGTAQGQMNTPFSAPYGLKPEPPVLPTPSVQRQWEQPLPNYAPPANATAGDGFRDFGSQPGEAIGIPDSELIRWEVELDENPRDFSSVRRHPYRPRLRGDGFDEHAEQTSQSDRSQGSNLFGYGALKHP